MDANTHLDHAAIVDLFRLDGKVALVTGAGRGIGRSLALALANAGADIAVVYRNHYAETEAAVRGLGRRFYAIHCDLEHADTSAVRGVIGETVSGLGRLDILVNNAGITRRGAALEMDEADWDAVIQVNLKAPFILAQSAAQTMAAQGHGKIINIASMMSFQGGLRIPAYTAAKSAIAGLTRALANEWAPLGINVNAIAPGYIETELTQPLRDDASRNASLLARIPAGRWGRPSDLDGVAVFLASAASDYMHGAIVAVDGGWLAA